MRPIVLLAFLSSVAPAQHSLQFDMETTTETWRGGKPEKTIAEASFAIVNPGRMRFESNAQGTTFLSMSKRERAVMYSSAKTAGAKAQPGMGMRLPDMTIVQSGAMREETIEIDGRKRDCWVVESRVAGMAITLWIDKKLMIDVQATAVAKIAGTPETEVRIKEVKKNLKIDEPIDQSLFAPAVDSKEVKTLSLFAGAVPDTDLTGKQAPAFEVQGSDGRPYSAWSLKGKPVLLAFWNAGSLPCRMSAPALGRIYQEYKDRDLLILGVDMGEDAQVRFPTVLSGDSGILGVYQVTTYPTFVLIGRDGRVVAHEVGFSGETTLREMLEKR